MRMRKLLFKDFITLQRGFDLPRKDMVEGPYPVVGSTSIIGWHNEFKKNPPGVVTGRSGSLGFVQFIKEKYWPHNTSLWVKDYKGNHPQYVYYFLKTVPLARFNSGAGVPTLNRNDLDTFEICIHDYNTQQKIAAILSAYDDLIENNTRRIKILEEIAQRIYQEWFVHFHYPDHENDKLTESELGMIPEGREVVRVENLVKRVSPGKLYSQKTASPKGSVPILDQGRSGIIGYHNEEPGIVASLNDPIIVFANHTCYQRLILHPFSAIQNVLPFLPCVENYRNIYWLHWATKDIIEFNDYKGHWPEFMTKKLFLSPPELCNKFGRIIQPKVYMIFRMQQKNEKLRQIRDLLLPKLISGKIDVSDWILILGR